MTTYDCTQDVLEHRRRVAFWLKYLTSDVLEYRAKIHDESKLHEPEKAIFDEYTPKLKIHDVTSDEYKEALKGMGEGLQHHYKANPHHPEFHPHGIDDMTIWDLTEMLADWMAACSVKNQPMNMDYLQDRFKVSPQLRKIIENTLWVTDMDMIGCNIPLDVAQLHNFYEPPAQP